MARNGAVNPLLRDSFSGFVYLLCQACRAFVDHWKSTKHKPQSKPGLMQVRDSRDSPRYKREFAWILDLFAS